MLPETTTDNKTENTKIFHLPAEASDDEIAGVIEWLEDNTGGTSGGSYVSSNSSDHGQEKHGITGTAPACLLSQTTVSHSSCSCASSCLSRLHLPANPQPMYRIRLWHFGHNDGRGVPQGDRGPRGPGGRRARPVLLRRNDVELAVLARV